MDEGVEIFEDSDGQNWLSVDGDDFVEANLNWGNPDEAPEAGYEDIPEASHAEEYCAFIKASIYVVEDEDDNADWDNHYWTEVEDVQQQQQLQSEEPMELDESLDSFTENGYINHEKQTAEIIEDDFDVGLPRDFGEFKSFVFKYASKYLDSGPGFVIRVMDKIKKLCDHNYSTVNAFVEYGTAVILCRILRLLAQATLEPDLIASEWTVAKVALQGDHQAAATLESNYGCNVFAEYVPGHVSTLMFKGLKTAALVDSVDSSTVFNDQSDEALINSKLEIQTELPFADAIGVGDKIRMSPLVKIPGYLVQAEELYKGTWSQFVEEQLLKPKFNIQATGLELVMSERTKSNFSDKELDGLQKTIDTVAQASGSSFCVLDYRDSHRDKEWISRLAVEIVIQLVRREKDLIMFNPEVVFPREDAPKEPGPKHKFFLITNEKLSICKIVDYLRKCEIIVYHATDELSYSPTEEEVTARAIKLLKKDIENAQKESSDSVSNLERALHLLESNDDSSGMSKREYEEAKVVREHVKFLGKLEILKESDLVIGTIEEITNDKIFRNSLNLGQIEKYYTALLYEASTIAETDLLTLGHFGVKKFILLDNKCTENSIMGHLIGYYQKNYVWLEKGSKSSVVSAWKPPPEPLPPWRDHTFDDRHRIPVHGHRGRQIRPYPRRYSGHNSGPRDLPSNPQRSNISHSSNKMNYNQGNHHRANHNNAPPPDRRPQPSHFNNHLQARPHFNQAPYRHNPPFYTSTPRRPRRGRGGGPSPRGLLPTPQSQGLLPTPSQPYRRPAYYPHRR